MNRALREGEFERPNLSDPSFYTEPNQPGQAERDTISGRNIWKTIRHFSQLSFLRSLPAFEDRNDEEWTIQHFIGGRSYGQVAQWVKKDQENQIIDEMAVKESNLRINILDHVLWNPQHNRGLLREAVIHAQLNKPTSAMDFENESMTMTAQKLMY